MDSRDTDVLDTMHAKLRVNFSLQLKRKIRCSKMCFKTLQHCHIGDNRIYKYSSEEIKKMKICIYEKNRFLTCDVADELIEICCKPILTLASFVAQKLCAYDDGNSTVSLVDNNAV